MIKNILINYMKNLIDYIALQSFPDFGKNALIDWNGNIIYYFFKIINYIVYLIDYMWL